MLPPQSARFYEKDAKCLDVAYVFLDISVGNPLLALKMACRRTIRQLYFELTCPSV